jgi:hypothetical protein
VNFPGFYSSLSYIIEKGQKKGAEKGVKRARKRATVNDPNITADPETNENDRIFFVRFPKRKLLPFALLSALSPPQRPQIPSNISSGGHWTLKEMFSLLLAPNRLVTSRTPGLEPLSCCCFLLLFLPSEIVPIGPNSEMLTS